MSNPTQPTGSSQAALSVAEGLTDAELSASIAVAYEGYTRRNAWSCWLDKGDEKGVLPKPYATSADAVCELLKDSSVEINHIHREKIGWQWEVKVFTSASYFPEEASAATLARALCIALLRASERNATREERG